MKALIALVGMQHRDAEALVASLPRGEPLKLVREPTNKFDPAAVMVFAHGKHVGYLKASQNKDVSRWMDVLIRTKGMQVTLDAILVIKDGRWPMVEVDV